MKKIENVDLTPITFRVGKLSEAQVKAFRDATRTQHAIGIPPTYATTFRKAEFEFLDRFEVDMRDLLHVDQEYFYHSPLTIGDEIEVKTSVEGAKERRGMVFVTLQTEIQASGVIRIAGNTTFVVRPKQ